MGSIIDKIKGKAKELEGRVTGRKKRKASGKPDKTKGEAKRVVKPGAKRAKRDVKGSASRTSNRARAGGRRVKSKTPRTRATTRTS